MTRPTVYVPDAIHDDGLALLEERARLLVGFGPHARGYDEVAGAIDAVILRTRRFDRAAIDAAPSLKVIARYGVGTDAIDVDAATERDIPVLITAEANYRSVAEHVFALLLAVRRRLLAADRMVRDDDFGARRGLLGEELHGSTLGVVGLGRIGRCVASIASAGFGMRVLGYDPYLSTGDLEDLEDLGVEAVDDLPGLLRRSDAVTVHTPLNDETRGLIGETELALLPGHAVVVQTSRGGVVDEAALHRALSAGAIAGAGIDVFSSEPPPVGDPLAAADNVVLSPHSAALTSQALRRMGLDAARGVLDVLDGVDPAARDRGWLAVNLPA